MLREVENHGFFATALRAIKQNPSHSDNKEEILFHCPEQGRCFEFTSSEELQDHMHLGEHNGREASESLYDDLRKYWRDLDWAMNFPPLHFNQR